MKTLPIFILLFCVSCATITKGDRQQVFVKGGPDKGMTKLLTPDGSFELDGGRGSIMLSRSKSDIPITVICPNGDKRYIKAETGFDWLAGFLGNFWTYFLGSLVDVVTNEGYDIDDVSLMNQCKESPTIHDLK